VRCTRSRSRPASRVTCAASATGFFTRIGRRASDPQIARVVGPADVERGLSRCQALVASQTTRVLLHGDLHLGNVLDGGGSGGLVAIDPRACAGDPCFDAVDYLLDGAGLRAAPSITISRSYSRAEARLEPMNVTS